MSKKSTSKSVADSVDMGHSIVKGEDGNTYDMWTVGYVPLSRPDLAKKVISEVESYGDTVCAVDVRITAYRKMRDSEFLETQSMTVKAKNRRGKVDY